MMSMKAEAVKAIASGKKRAEVMKKRPSLLELPLKVYIYESKGRLKHNPNIGYTAYQHSGRGVVVGECVCHNVKATDLLTIDEATISALHMKTREITEYLKGETGYIYFFSDFQMYDQAIPLSVFGKRTTPNPWYRVEERTE
jgi:predicted transcriptional regulator